MTRSARSTAGFPSVFLAAAAFVFTAAAFALPQTAAPQAAPGKESPAAAALARLAGLAGEWEGTVEWEGRPASRGPMNARYFTSGNATAVVESLIVDGMPSMTTVYHLDGADLRMTHYCVGGNQPRLKASKIDLANGAIDFAFVDVTNLPAPDAPHVTGLEVRLADADHVKLTFIVEGRGKPARENISLQRARTKA